MFYEKEAFALAFLEMFGLQQDFLEDLLRPGDTFRLDVCACL